LEQIATTRNIVTESAKGILKLVKERDFDASIKRAVSGGRIG